MFSKDDYAKMLTKTSSNANHQKSIPPKLQSLEVPGQNELSYSKDIVLSNFRRFISTRVQNLKPNFERRTIFRKPKTRKSFMTIPLCHEISKSPTGPQNPSSEDKPKAANNPSCFNNKYCWWDPPDESLVLDFCRDSSLHGLKYIGQPRRHLSERIFWLVAFLCGLILAVVLISDVWMKYNTSPIIVSFQSFETNVDEIPFPAVTICNMNKILKTKAEEYIKKARIKKSEEAIEDVFYLDHVCSATKSFAKKFNYSYGRGDIDDDLLASDGFRELTKVKEFLRKSSQNCSDMIVLCLWQDKEYNCSQLFRPIETDFGKCCTFNMVPLSVLYTMMNDERDDEYEINQWLQWRPDSDGLLLSNYGNEFPRRQMQAGKSFGLSFLLNPSLDEYFCTTSDSTGFRMATHLSIDVPHVTDFGISVRPASEVFVNVQPEITIADRTIFKFDLNTRRCYRLGEYSLKYYKFYTPSNCVDECIANATMDECGCKRYYMPRDENQTLCGGNSTGFQCAEDVKYNMTKFGARSVCSACYASCTELDYRSQSTTTPLQEGIWMKNQQESARWKDQNVSIVHVFFGQDSTYSRIRKELFGSTDLFANTGGLMGLCLGFSGLSAMEVVYFLTLRAWWATRRKKNVRNRVIKRLKDAWAKTKVFKFIGKLQGNENEHTGKMLEFSKSTIFTIPKNNLKQTDEANNQPNVLQVKNNSNSSTVPNQRSVDYRELLGSL